MNNVAVVVVTYNSAPMLDTFLERIAAALKGILDWKLVIVDNQSTDGTLELAERSRSVDIVVRPPANGGYAAGINAGIRAAPEGTDCYLVLNPDVELKPGCIAPLVEALKQPGVGIVAPRLLDEHGGLQYSLRREPCILRALGEACLGGFRAGRWPAVGELVVDPDAYSQPTIADWATGGALMFSRECIDTIGLWDESFFLYEEEVEFCLRARDAGFALQLVPESEMVRFVGDEPDKPHFRALMRHNKLRHYRQRNGALRGELFRLALLLNEVLRLPTRRKGVGSAIRALCTGKVAVLEARRSATADAEQAAST